MAKFGDYAVGDIVKLNVNGVATDFIVVHQGLPSSNYDNSCDGTWLLMKDIYTKEDWDSYNGFDYTNSSIDSYLNSTFLNLFDSDVKSAIKRVKIPYYNEDAEPQTGANGYSTKIFLLAIGELGYTRDVPDSMQNPLDYFNPWSSAKNIAYYNGTVTDWWLRTIGFNTDGELRCFYISDSGGRGRTNNSGSTSGVRPALILPSDFEISESSFNGKAFIGGVQKDLIGGKVNIGGAWKDISSVQINVGGTWKLMN